MSFKIDDFIASLQKGGMRTSLFKVTMAPPAGVSVGEDLTFKCKATSIPGSELGVIEMPFMGRTAKIAGDRKFGEWTISVIAEQGNLTHRMLNDWLDLIQDAEGNLSSVQTPQNYMVTATVQTYGTDGKEDQTYEMRGCFPSNVGEIALAWENQDQVGEFDATFQMQYFVRVK